MHPFLLAALAAMTALLLTLIAPERRHVRALQVGAVAALLACLAAWLWPMHAAAIGIGLLACVLLWLAGRALLWPLRFVGQVLRVPARPHIPVI